VGDRARNPSDYRNRGCNIFLKEKSDVAYSNHAETKDVRGENKACRWKEDFVLVSNTET
jgi:hypothetical protein